jgi:hypothetical protein
MNSKVKLLITLSFSFSIRYIIRTGLLEKIKAFADPVIILTWEQTDLIEELTRKGYEVHILPAVEHGVEYNNIRRKINYWFDQFRLRNYRKIQEKYLSLYLPLRVKFLKWIVKQYNIVKLYIPGKTTELFQEEARLLTSDTNYQEIVNWIESLHASAVFTITPFHSREDIFLRACKQVGLKMITSILSFDNITKRGWIPVTYDMYMVWNYYNLKELYHIYPETKKRAVHVVGAPQFDFYNKPEWLLPLDKWMSQVGINGNNTKKIILYAGGPKDLFPEEPIYLKHIDEAIESNAIKNRPLILFRCHPVDNIQRWIDAVGTSENIIIDTTWTGKDKLQLANITENDIKKLCSTLQYTDVHVNLCSTMTLDGSAFGKPQIGPAYLTNKRTSKLLKQMYFQKHFKPIVLGKGIELANSKEELITKINEALLAPSKFTNNSKRVLTDIITYTDNRATERVATLLFDFLNKIDN